MKTVEDLGAVTALLAALLGIPVLRVLLLLLLAATGPSLYEGPGQFTQHAMPKIGFGGFFTGAAGVCILRFRSRHIRSQNRNSIPGPIHCGIEAHPRRITSPRHLSPSPHPQN